MKHWEKALLKFLKKWENREEVIGAMVCGSYVVGGATEHSDIDLHIILRDGTTWKERGNTIIGEYLIEYFANPSSEIESYFKEDGAEGRTSSMVQFLTGKVLFDRQGEMKRLKRVAKSYFEKKLPAMTKLQVESTKYHLWDMCDNLQDRYKQNDPAFFFAVHDGLRILYQKYATFLRVPKTNEYKLIDYFTSGVSRKKYLQQPFPDRIFSKIMVEAMTTKNKTVLLDLYKQLTEHVLKKMGGFTIDGWSMRSPIT